MWKYTETAGTLLFGRRGGDCGVGHPHRLDVPEHPSGLAKHRREIFGLRSGDCGVEKRSIVAHIIAGYPTTAGFVVFVDAVVYAVLVHIAQRRAAGFFAASFRHRTGVGTDEQKGKRDWQGAGLNH